MNLCKNIAKNILEQLAECSLPEWDQVIPTIRVLHLQAGEFLFRAEESQPFVFFVGTGVIKMVYETVNGKEWIKAFASENLFFSSLSALRAEGKTSFSSMAICDSVLERVDYEIIKTLSERHLAWQRVLRRAFEIYGERKEKREKDLLTLSAEERYRRFLIEYPNLRSRISDKDLAAYIRVTPVGLSRIKTRVQQTKYRNI